VFSNSHQFLLDFACFALIVSKHFHALQAMVVYLIILTKHMFIIPQVAQFRRGKIAISAGISKKLPPPAQTTKKAADHQTDLAEMPADVAM
jgi:hypothetical protein